MGPFKPTVRGGYAYVSKIPDQFTKSTAFNLLCTMDQALASLQLFATSTVIPLGSRIVTWRVDKGGEHTDKDFEAYCQETGHTQQFAAINKLQQIGVSERVGRTLCAMVRCMHIDSVLSPFLRAELIVAAPYICNRIPHSALNIETPYRKLYGKDADLSHLKIIGARVFIHIKNPNKLDHTSCEGMLCGLSETENNSYLEPENASRGRDQERYFHRNTTKRNSCHQAALAATKSRVTVVRFQRRYTRRQLRLSRRHAAGRAELHLRF